MADTVIENADTPLDIFETLSNIPDDKDDKKDDKKDEIPLKQPKAEDEAEEDEETKEETDEEDSEEDSEESDEDEEEDDEINLDDDKDEDELELAKIPTRSQIKAKYPNIFKEFKALDHILYREKAFAEVFPTVKDAKSAKSEINEYNKIQDELLSGDIVGTLSRVKTSNPKAYNKIAENIIESLIKVDKDSYIAPARMVIKTALNNLYSLASTSLKKDANNKKAEQIQIAAELIHESLFGTSEVSGYEKAKEDKEDENPEIKQLREERAQLSTQKFQDAHKKVSTTFDNLVTRTLENNIDKKGVLTTYVKNNLIKDVKNELDKQLISDKRFGGIVKKLYERAREANYSEESINTIVSALKGKAGSLLQDIITAKKGEALRGTSSVKKAKSRELSREKESDDATTRNSRNSEERLTRGERKKESDEPRPGESVFDYLDRKLG